MKFRKGKHSKLTLFTLLLVIFTLPIISVIGVDYQLNSYLGSEPTIDGIVSKEERNAAGKPEEMLMPFDEWFALGDQKPRYIEIVSIHTNSSKLYIYTKIEFKGILEGNISFFMRKLGSDDYYDYKVISSLTNSAIDGYRIPHEWPYFNDIESGGTNDAEGKCFITDKYMTFELLMPYNSEDTNGHDLNITLNDEIEIYYTIRLKYLNTNWEPWNAYAWPNTDTWKIVFHSTSATVPINLLVVLFGLIVIPLIIHFKRKQISL